MSAIDDHLCELTAQDGQPDNRTMLLQPVLGSTQRNATNIVLLNNCYRQCVQSSDIGANVHYSAVFAAIINGRPMNGLTITQFKAEQIVHVRRPNLFPQLSCVS